MKISCAITAGGKAKRLNGITKAFIEIDGTKIIERNIQVLKPIFQEIIIISNNKPIFLEYNLRVFEDFYHNIGPIAGLHSALKNTNCDAVFLLGSDLPFISSNIISNLIDDYKTSDCDILIPTLSENIEPLCGIYNKNLVNKLELFIENKKSYALRDFFKEVNTKYQILDNTVSNKKAFLNINNPSDLEI